MTDKELAFSLKYSSSKELYVVTWDNTLKLLYCPFKAIANRNIGLLKKEQVVFVEEVKVTQELQTVYIIKNIAYYYFHFEILLER
ncbi:hypothetical protein [Olleya sp. 1-3]|uniref:hypothetical protein n=1 Tax=Olleya sp. 1-3 TaxID=2058323 RepID=UPI000C32E402|nr:hypothetical protein [Olleya sp. 1-3]PKG52918.1 hypothetical protein CXF54_03855 [Olleya sp. 1-3]